MICFAAQEIRLINAGIVIDVENVLPKQLSWRCTNFTTVGRSHFYKKNCEFCEKLFPKSTSQMTHMFCSHRRKDLQFRIVIFVENILRKPLSRWCTNFATKPSLEGELRVFVKNCSQNQSPRWVTCLLTQEKSLTNAVIVISVENIYKTAVLKTHKFCHFWRENCEFCEQMYSTPTSQTSPMLTHTGEKLYKRRSVIYVENIFLNHWHEDAQI